MPSNHNDYQLLQSEIPSFTTPEQKLVCAVLERAIKDAIGKTKLKKELSDKEVVKARAWFRSKSDHSFSFLFICEYLKLDSISILATIKTKDSKKINRLYNMLRASRVN